jgi:hypothetical protein
MGKRSLQTALAFLLFCDLALVVLHPLVWNIDRLPAGGDAYEYAWKLWWVQESLFRTHRSPWFAPQLYYPFGYNLCYGEITPANTVLAAPLTYLLGEVVTYNIIVLLSTALSGFGTFLLVREVTGSARAGLLSGVLFALTPYRRVRLVHLNLISTQWLPLYLYFLERFLRTSKQRYALAAGLTFGLNSLTSWYYAVIGAAIGIVWYAFRLRNSEIHPKRIRTGIALFTLTTIVLVAPFLLPYLPIIRMPSWTTPLKFADKFSAGLVDYALPNPFNPLWGNFVRQRAFGSGDELEFALGWGIVSWTFGLYALRRENRTRAAPWLTMVFLGVTFSLGPTFHLIRGIRLTIPAPSSVTTAWNRLLNFFSLHLSLLHEPFVLGATDGLVIPMPALLMRWFVPIMGKMRTWTRWGVAALVGATTLAGQGALTWHRRETAPNRSRLGRQMVWTLVVGIALMELWWCPPSPHDPYPVRPVDRWLSRQEPAGAIIQYPLSSAVQPIQFAYSRAHKWPMAYAYGSYFPFIFVRRHPELLDFPAPSALSTLKSWNVWYVLVETGPPYTQEAERLLDRIARVPCLQKVTTQGTIEVYRLVASLPCGPERP